MLQHLRWPRGLLLAAALLFSLSARAVPQDDRWSAARDRMVREEVIEAGILNERVWAAMRATPRHLFVSSSLWQQAYYDMALPIGEGQTISSPYIVAFMTEALDPQPRDKVLEIGTGSGYQAAVLSRLVAEVYSIEIVASLGRKAAQTLRRVDCDNVQTRIGDGYQGWPEHAPFDKIIVTCSPERIPPALVAQLREGGRIVIPLGERYQQSLYLFRKQNGEMVAEELRPTFFVPMTGKAEQVRRVHDDSGLPRLINGSFEETDDEGELKSWYYVRQAEVVADGQAIEGQRYLRFKNDSPGRGSQARQPLAMDGSKVREIEISVSIATEEVHPGQNTSELPRVEISFFDERRAPLSTQALGPWYGTIRWTRKQARFQVPPRARLAVIGIGLFGGVGQLSLDQMTVTVTEGDTSP